MRNLLEIYGENMNTESIKNYYYCDNNSYYPDDGWEGFCHRNERNEVENKAKNNEGCEEFNHNIYRLRSLYTCKGRGSIFVFSSAFPDSRDLYTLHSILRYDYLQSVKKGVSCIFYTLFA